MLVNCDNSKGNVYLKKGWEYMPAVNPIALNIFNIDIRWYGVLVTLGMIMGLILGNIRAKSHGIEPEKTLDFLIICIPMGVIGARAYYVLFNWSSYDGEFWEIINLRHGGLAIHGGLIAGILTAVLLCRLWKINSLSALDLAVPSIALAQAVGRWGNYFNGEAHGGPTNLPWAIMVEGEMVHPTFLYESIWCLIACVVLIFIARDRKFNGQIFLLYCMLYSFERFFVEYLRTDSLMLFGALKQAMVLSFIVFIIALISYVVISKKAARAGKIFYGGPSKYIGKFKR